MENWDDDTNDSSESGTQSTSLPSFSSHGGTTSSSFGSRGGFGNASRGGFSSRGGFGSSSLEGGESSQGNFSPEHGSFGSSSRDGGERGGFRGRGRGFGGGHGGFGRNDRGEDSNRRFNGHGDGNEKGGFHKGFNSEERESFGGRGGFRGGRGGFRGGLGGSSNDGENSSGRFSGRRFRNDDSEDAGGFGGGRGGGFDRRRHSEDGNTGEDGAPKERPPLYIPPPPSEDDEELFRKLATGINFDKYDHIPVEITGQSPTEAVRTFEEANIREHFLNNVKRIGYAKPTPVQKYAMPAISAGRDLMACAQTGSGKTAAFLLPVMTKMMEIGLESSEFSETQSPLCVIMAPTRELARQIHFEVFRISSGTILRGVVLYGGTSVGAQLREVERGCHLVVATPGRLLDVINRRKIDLGSVKFLILDEADRMLDMGFLPDIQKIVEQLGMPTSADGRQTLMFSATFARPVQDLARKFLQNYLFLTVGVLGGAASDVQQTVQQVDELKKRNVVIELLSDAGQDRTIVFVETKRTADFLASHLCQQGFPATSIHGDRLQKEREEALGDFKKGRNPILVATSVASRGLDIENVKHIINYDLPKEIEDYVHRIGRTGRIGNIGQATSFFVQGKDDSLARSLVKVLADARQEVPKWLEETAESAVGSGYGPSGGRFGGKDIREFNRTSRPPPPGISSKSAPAADDDENWDV